LVVGSGVLLVGQNKIEDLLNQTETWIENNVTEFRTTEYSFLHLFKWNILEAEDFLSVMIGNRCPLHTTDLHLHNVLQEPTSN
jgi:hypothetical protein